MNPITHAPGHAEATLSEEEGIASLLNARIVRSERLRAGALVALSSVFVLVIALVWCVPGILPAGSEALYRPALKVMAAVLVLMGVYESAVWIGLARWQRAMRPVPEGLRYVNALVEISVPTLVIWDWSSVAGPLQTVCGVLPFLYFTFIAASALHLSPRLCLFIGTVAALGFTSIAFLISRGFASADTALLMSGASFVLKGFMMFVCGAVAAFVAAQLRSHLFNAVKSARERDRAVGIFGQHVSPQVARRLIEQPAEVTAEQRHVCVLFLDIRGFSDIAAERTPAEVMDYLNELFAPMITIVNQHGGIVNKFLGDGFMAIFGAPLEDPELHRNAVRCSLALLKCVEELNAIGSIPKTRIGIGLHAGNAMAGTVGNVERKEYTLLGDTVNAAARIEQETKKLGAQIIVSDAVLDGMTEEKNNAIELGEMALRGISRPLRLYKLA